MCHCHQTNGWDYHFNPSQNLRSQDDALRAGFLQYQTYPKNSVQGAGQLVAPNGIPGKYWKITQQPQLFANQIPVISSLIAGGTNAGGILFQPLVDTSASMG